MLRAILGETLILHFTDFYTMTGDCHDEDSQEYIEFTYSWYALNFPTRLGLSEIAMTSENTFDGFATAIDPVNSAGAVTSAPFPETPSIDTTEYVSRLSHSRTTYPFVTVRSQGCMRYQYQLDGRSVLTAIRPTTYLGGPNEDNQWISGESRPKLTPQSHEAVHSSVEYAV